MSATKSTIAEKGNSMLRIAILVAAAAALSACAYGDAKLALAYDGSTAKAGVLSEAPATTIYLADVEDRRVEKQRIGYKRNGFGAKTADIVSERPVPEIVEEALASALQKNGHILGGPEERFAIKPALTNFWFDYKTGFVTVEFYGQVQTELSVVDQSTGTAIYSEVFDGYYSEKTGGGLKKTWQRIMNAALADLVSKINLSEGLKDALASANAAAGPALSTDENPGS
jgi:ABC-type uncharacterized transport system auxiliary subunit